jgi:hypothetical protein
MFVTEISMCMCHACLHTQRYHTYRHVKARLIPLIEKSIFNINAWCLVSETNGQIRTESRKSVVLGCGGESLTDRLA